MVVAATSLVVQSAVSELDEVRLSWLVSYWEPEEAGVVGSAEKRVLQTAGTKGYLLTRAALVRQVAEILRQIVRWRSICCFRVERTHFGRTLVGNGALVVVLGGEVGYCPD